MDRDEDVEVRDIEYGMKRREARQSDFASQSHYGRLRLEQALGEEMSKLTDRFSGLGKKRAKLSWWESNE